MQDVVVYLNLVLICEVILNSHIKCRTRPHWAKPRPALPDCHV